jgi:predicted transcriptional regulator
MQAWRSNAGSWRNYSGLVPVPTVADFAQKDADRVWEEIASVLMGSYELAAVALSAEQDRHEARAEEGIRQGLEDARSGRTRPAREVFDEIHAEHPIPH